MISPSHMRQSSLYQWIYRVVFYLLISTMLPIIGIFYFTITTLHSLKEAVLMKKQLITVRAFRIVIYAERTH